MIPKNEESYELQATVAKIQKDNTASSLKTSNAKVGNENSNFQRTMVGQGIFELHENGQQRVEFCIENGVVITGTIFQH